ncbi:MAG: response regulator [Anaerolineaceae bacterium]|jgi:CheY-like chemotaxis protein/MinD-like ATPase involved in chromosome partitioning or flagellar assembly|nr:response regulator [Anaerolineaceae bacterium]
MVDKVLIVDDDVETLRLVGLMLQRQGYQIIAANNGNQALTLAQSEQPDLIVLDVMMPDMDGFQVTRQLRTITRTSRTPILMFTAKTQVDDKVTGYDAGVDDYLTKPVHPAELVAHVKSLLARRRPPEESPAQKGYVIGVMAPKGGLGVSSLALNLAISYSSQTKSEVVAAELRPGQGTWAIDLGFPDADGLKRLLSMPANEIHPETVENELVRPPYGSVRLLLANNQLDSTGLNCASDQFEAIIKSLQTLSPLILLDIGANHLPGIDQVVSQCDHLLLITDPFPATVERTRVLLEELGTHSFSKSKLINLVIVNRVRSDIQLSVHQVQEKLGHQITQVIPPAPELAYQAALHNTPLVIVQPEGLVAQQYNRLANFIDERVKK